MCLLWFRYDFDMILICQRLWFSYGFGVSPFFDMILIRFSYGFGVSPFFWYDFDMIFLWFWSLSVFLIWFSYGFGVPPSFWYDFVIVFFRPHFPPPSPDPGHTSHPPSSGPRHTSHPCRRTPATPSTPVAGPRPHLPRPSPDPPPIPWPDSGTRGTLWFQTLVSFWFFWISMDVAACYRPTEFSLNISFTILWVRLARRRGFQCCC